MNKKWFITVKTFTRVSRSRRSSGSSRRSSRGWSPWAWNSRKCFYCNKPFLIISLLHCFISVEFSSWSSEHPSLYYIYIYIIFTNRARGLYCCIKTYTTIKPGHEVCKWLLKFTFCLVSHWKNKRIMYYNSSIVFAVHWSANTIATECGIFN